MGIDSGWASCLGVNGSWHDAEGQPVVNLTSFPSMKKMVDYGVAIRPPSIPRPHTSAQAPVASSPHARSSPAAPAGHSKGVSMGFYLNQDLDPGYHSCKSTGALTGAQQMACRAPTETRCSNTVGAR